MGVIRLFLQENDQLTNIGFVKDDENKKLVYKVWVSYPKSDNIQKYKKVESALDILKNVTEHLKKQEKVKWNNLKKSVKLDEIIKKLHNLNAKAEKTKEGECKPCCIKLRRIDEPKTTLEKYALVPASSPFSIKLVKIKRNEWKKPIKRSLKPRKKEKIKKTYNLRRHKCKQIRCKHC